MLYSKRTGKLTNFVRVNGVDKMHALEKILARHSNVDHVTAGDIVSAKVDFAEINDLYLQTIYSFYEMGGTKVYNSEKAAFVFDHFAPCSTARSAENHGEMRRFAQENNLKYHFDVNTGVCHQVLPEAGLVYPGMILVATDSHTTTHGAFGAFGTGCGATDMACILMEGETWFRVPEIIEIRLEGAPQAGVFAKDVILHILGKVKADGAVYSAIDFTGSYVEGLSVSERMTICNMAVEMGAKTSYMQPNQAVIDYVSARCEHEFTPEFTDEDFVYARTYVFNLSELEPQLACPNRVDNVHSISEVCKNRIDVDQGYIGSCTNGRLDDLAIAARILEGKKIPPYKRLMIVPASAQVMKEATSLGYIQTFIDAGATIVTPGCAACLGVHEGLLGAGEVCISSTNRNFTGRMGSKQADIYLGSPATVAASILNGCLTDPREYLD